jgi:hypothetical protein
MVMNRVDALDFLEEKQRLNELTQRLVAYRQAAGQAHQLDLLVLEIRETLREYAIAAIEPWGRLAWHGEVRQLSLVRLSCRRLGIDAELAPAVRLVLQGTSLPRLHQLCTGEKLPPIAPGLILEDET